MKTLNEAFNKIQIAINSLKNNDYRRKTQEEFDKFPKDSSLYKIKSDDFEIELDSTLEIKKIYQEYIKKQAIKLINEFSLPEDKITVKAIEISNGYQVSLIIKEDSSVFFSKFISFDEIPLRYEFVSNKKEMIQDDNGSNISADCTYIYTIKFLDNEHETVWFNVNHSYKNPNAIALKDTANELSSILSKHKTYYFWHQVQNGKDFFTIFDKNSKNILDSNNTPKITDNFHSIAFEDNKIVEQTINQNKIVEKNGQKCSREINITSNNSTSFEKTTTTIIGDSGPNIIKETGELKEGELLTLEMLSKQ